MMDNIRGLAFLDGGQCWPVYRDAPWLTVADAIVQGTAAKRAEQLRRMVGEYGQCSELAHVRVPLPLDPAVMLTGILSEECSVFKSALSPLRLTFRTAGAVLSDTIATLCASPASHSTFLLEYH